ncbi:Hypothetical predicted protein [Olea europaea subsp. europaea]|uniref:Uncharacterized protein n=1 Tax=Olea europaea subsp. europaea TaxID=158383 RepID=A0A8S0U473_OLEEU|nr:Hypothetical predicted protein [Olea europaea subsp. europaea]
MVAPYTKGILYKKSLQPHAQRDMQFGDTGDVGTSVPVQSHTPRLRLLMIIDGCKVYSNNVEDDEDDDFVDTPPRRKKTPFHFHPPTEEHATRKYYPIELEGHNIHTLAQPQAIRTDDEPKPAVTDIKQNIDGKGKGKMNPADEIEYPSFPLTSSFNLGVASTPIISNEVDAIIAGLVKDCEIEE